MVSGAFIALLAGLTAVDGKRGVGSCWTVVNVASGRASGLERWWFEYCALIFKTLRHAGW